MNRRYPKIIYTGLVFTFTFLTFSFAEVAKDLKDSATKCACEINKDKPVACFDTLKAAYFKENKYSEFVEFIKTVCPDNKSVVNTVNYLIALARYSQLKYLEESKGWDEYFSKGNDYRDEIVSATQKAIAATTTKDPIHNSSLLLAYQFHKDQQDVFTDQSLIDLMDSILEYARISEDLGLVKETADKLLAYEEKGKAKELYKLYAQKLVTSDIKDQDLKDIAVNFYKEGNLELAENIYDIYIEKISKVLSKDKQIKELFLIAGDFVYKTSGNKDMFYAEKLFKKVEALGGKEAFNEELMYMRGFNLEKAKAYDQAKDVYLDFISRFPKSIHVEQLTYKVGVIFTYILRDAKKGREYFNKLSEKQPVSANSIASLYQLGLLSQWEEDLPSAKIYYKKIIDKIGDIDPDRLALTNERLKEINDNKPIDYNLKIALDTALKEEFATLDMSKLDLKVSNYEPEKGTIINIGSSALVGSSGCLQVELQYLWSGDMGGQKPGVNQSEISVNYKTPGVQLVSLVLVSPTGITERSIDLIDVK